MIATTTTTATATMPTKTGTANMHANTASAPLPFLPRRASSSSSIAPASSAASIADLTSTHNEEDGSSSSSSSSSTPRKSRRVRGMRGVPPPELAASFDGVQASESSQLQPPSRVPFPAPAPAAVSAASPIQKSQPLLYTPGMSLMSLRLASLPKPQSPKQQRPGPLPLSPPSSSAPYTSVLTYAPASYSKPTSSSSAPYTHTHTHAHPGQQRSLSSPPSATPKTPTTPVTPGGTPEVRKKCGQLVKSSLKSSRSYSSSSSISISSSSSMNSPLPASSSGLSVCTNGSGAYASSRSEPTTPTASKAVHFDNARLEFVRLFLAEQRPLAVSRDGSPTPDGDGEYDSSGLSDRDGEGRGSGSGKEKECERQVEGGDERTTRLTMNLALAPPPGLLTDPRLVALESMRLVPSKSSEQERDNGRERESAVVHGSVRVRNLAYSKAVWARFTLDGWRTTSEVCARWVESVGGTMSMGESIAAPVRGVGSDELGAAIAAEEEERRRRRGAEWDRFAFTIDLSGLALGDLGANGSGKERRLELAVKYVVDSRDQEAMWDNNGGRNYVATFARERVPASNSTSTNGSGPSASAMAMAKSVAAANQAYYAQQASLQQQQQQQQQHLPQRRQVRRFRVQEQAVEDGSGSSEESTETEARAATRRGRMMPVRAASAPASAAGVQLSSSSTKSKGRDMGTVSIRATEEERDMADLKSKLEKVAAQGDAPSGRVHAHQQHRHHASPRASPSRAGGGGGSSSSSQSSTPTTFTYTAMHHTHSMSTAMYSGKANRRSESPTEYSATASARRDQTSPSVPLARASAIHQRTQSFPQSGWRGQQLAHQQQHQTSIYATAATDGGYVYAPSLSFSRSPQQHLGSPRDLWDGDDSAFHHSRSAERGYFDILPSSSQAISRTAVPAANAITVTITGSTPPQMASSSAEKSYPPSTSSTRGVGLGMSLLSPDSALSTPGMVSPASTSSSSSSSEDDDDDDEDVNSIDLVLSGHLAAAAHQHQLALEDDPDGVLPMPMKGVAGSAATAVGMDVAMSGETPYRQFLDKFCFFTGPGTGAASPLNAAVSLVPVSGHGHGQGHVGVLENAHALAYQALPGASPPRHQRGHGARPTPSSSVETVVGLGARA